MSPLLVYISRLLGLEEANISPLDTPATDLASELIKIICSWIIYE